MSIIFRHYKRYDYRHNAGYFTERTAQNYMKCCEYSAKTQELAYLQEAYKLIESEESKKKASKAEEVKSKIEYRKQRT